MFLLSLILWEAWMSPRKWKRSSWTQGKGIKYIYERLRGNVSWLLLFCKAATGVQEAFSICLNRKLQKMETRSLHQDFRTIFQLELSTNLFPNIVLLITVQLRTEPNCGGFTTIIPKKATEPKLSENDQNTLVEKVECINSGVENFMVNSSLAYHT